MSYSLALQMRNLHDALAANDILDMTVASLECDGWDTHGDQRLAFATLAGMLFGSDGALATLDAVLPASARRNTVFLIG